jgi:hypothetical protein
MSYPGLRIARCILLKAFLIGFVMHLIFAAIVLCGSNFWMPMVSTVWHISDPQWYWKIAAEWFAVSKFFLFYILLVPGLAIHCTLKRLDKACS